MTLVLTTEQKQFALTSAGARGPRGPTGADGIEIAGLMGVPALSPDLGTGWAGIVPDNPSAKEAIQALESAIADIALITLTPLQFGATGLGTGNDGPALNAMFDRVRELLTENPFTIVVVNGGNQLYRTTDSINVTNLSAWNLTVENLYLVGACTGKAVIDAIGTRGYTFKSVGIWGEKANRPAVGFQAQRGTAGGFCDNASFKECFTDGYFTRAAAHDYGQETTQWDHCTIYNRDHTGRVAIHEGYDAHEMTSDYASVMTGATSFINKQFLNCDWRYLPADENIAAITNVVSGATTVVTAPGHQFQIGDDVCFQYVGGMTDMMGAKPTVIARTSTTLTVDLDTTGYPAYTSGGVVIRQAEQSPLYIARTEGFSTESCYVVSYGQPPIEVGFPDPGFPRCEQLHLLNILFEGAGQECAVKFSIADSVSMQGFSLTTYNGHQYVSLLGGGAAGEVVTMYGPRVESVDPIFNVPLVPDPKDRFAAFGASFLYYSLSLVAPEDWADFNGQITSIVTGKNTLYVADAVYLNGGAMKIPGTFGTDGTGVFMNIVMDGVTYKFRPSA